MAYKTKVVNPARKKKRNATAKSVSRKAGADIAAARAAAAKKRAAKKAARERSLAAALGRPAPKKKATKKKATKKKASKKKATKKKATKERSKAAALGTADARREARARSRSAGLGTKRKKTAKKTAKKKASKKKASRKASSRARSREAGIGMRKKLLKEVDEIRRMLDNLERVALDDQADQVYVDGAEKAVAKAAISVSGCKWAKKRWPGAKCKTMPKKYRGKTGQEVLGGYSTKKGWKKMVPKAKLVRVPRLDNVGFWGP